MDWFGNITAERVISNSTDKWNYPSLYYTFTVQCSEGGDTIQIVMVRRGGAACPASPLRSARANAHTSLTLTGDRPARRLTP